MFGTFHSSQSIHDETMMTVVGPEHPWANHDDGRSCDSSILNPVNLTTARAILSGRFLLAPPGAKYRSEIIRVSIATTQVMIVCILPNILRAGIEEKSKVLLQVLLVALNEPAGNTENHREYSTTKLELLPVRLANAMSSSRGQIAHSSFVILSAINAALAAGDMCNAFLTTCAYQSTA